MPGITSPHGTTVSFDGVPIGYLTGYDIECQAGDVQEVTNVLSQVVGTGMKARVVKQYDATSVEPPTLSLEFLGPPSFLATDAGLKGEIVFDSPGFTLSGEAILRKFNHSGRAGQWTRGTAVFMFTGSV